MGWICGYIKNVGYFVVFASLIRLAVPKGSFRSYVDMFIGIVFIIIMLSPFEGMFRMGSSDLEDHIYSRSAELGRALISAEGFEEGAEIAKKEHKRLIEERAESLCGECFSGVRAEAVLGDDFDVEEIRIWGRQKPGADPTGLKGELSAIFGVGEDKIFFCGEVE